MSQLTLTRAERLRSLKVIRRLFEQGRSGFVYPFRYMWLMEECEGAQGDVTEGAEGATEGATEVAVSGAVSGAVSAGVEVMFSVPKRFLKRANKRHYVRRRAKESYRLNKGGLVASVGDRKLYIALIYSTKKIHQYKTINNAVERILGQIGNDL